MVPVVIALVRVYLGWAYVGDRLLSAVVEYEETGWRAGGAASALAGSVCSSGSGAEA